MLEPCADGRRLFTFAVVADSHVTEAEAEAIGGYDADAVLLNVERCRYVVEEINRRAPDFVIHLGDITHPGPGTPAYKESAERFHRVFEELECPWHLVPGNHDIGEKAFPGDPLADQDAQLTVNDDMIAEYERHFQSQYHAFEHEDCLFVVMNGMIVNSGLAAEDRQRRWLESLLADNHGRRIFVFSHYPPYLSHAGETGHYDATDEPGRSWLLGLFARHGVEAQFAGHVHNFFFNRHDGTSMYVLPSTSFLRHDYHELFRAAPGVKQGRHDTAKLGYGVVDVHETGHLLHVIRTFGRTCEAGRAPAAIPVHGLDPDQRGIGLDLRHPWCESAHIPTPWGLDSFRRKPIRNDYPLLALWEMGVSQLRVPLDDLADPDTGQRMAELAALGHRFTAFSYGLPVAGAREALVEYGHHLDCWEVIAPVLALPELLPGIAGLRGDVPVLFNAFRPESGMFSCSHGLGADERGVVESLLALDGARHILDGVVFGIDRKESPVKAIEAARGSVAGLGVKAVAHVRFSRHTPPEREEDAGFDANRVAESVTAAMCFDDVAVVLDNFTGIDRGYHFCGGLVDRLYNPQAGAHIVRNLHRMLKAGCQVNSLTQRPSITIMGLEGTARALLLPSPGMRDVPVPEVQGVVRDLVKGDAVSGWLAGPALVLDS